MLKNKLFTIALPITALTILLGVAACGGSSGGGTTSTAYSGPGSKWDISLLSNNTFSITHRETASDPIDMTVTGSYTRQANGIVKLTVGAAVNGSGGALSSPANGDTAWALDVPGYAFMLRPMDASNDQLIPMVVSGGCPTSNLNGNWVTVKTNSGTDATSAGRDFFGTFTYDTTTQTGNLPARYSLANPTSNIGANSIGNGTCSDGIMSISDGIMYLATNGAIVRTGTDTPADATDDNFIFALGQKSLTTVANLEGSYAGMLFDDNNASGSKINPVKMVCDNAGACSATQFDTDLTTELSGSVAFDFSGGTADTPSTGWINGTITDTGSGNLSCMIDIDAAGTGKKIASCVGQSPDDNTKLFNVLFVSI